jgi:hypothetical protein
MLFGSLDFFVDRPQEVEGGFFIAAIARCVSLYGGLEVGGDEEVVDEIIHVEI